MSTLSMRAVVSAADSAPGLVPAASGVWWKTLPWNDEQAAKALHLFPLQGTPDAEIEIDRRRPML
jgi:hypothetical protein